MSDSQALSILVKSPVTQQMIQLIVNVTLKVIKCKKSKTFLPSPPNSPNGKSKPLPSLMTFISKLVRYTNVYSGTLLSTLVYLEKLSHKLPKNSQGLPCTLHRIFLACLIISSKFNNDSSPKNSHWADYTDGLFTLEDINLMERQLLNLLNFDVKISNNDLSRVLKIFIDPIKQDLKIAQRIRRSQKSPSSPRSPSSSPRSNRPQQLPPSPVSYNDILKNSHYRSSSVTSLSSSTSSNSLSSISSDEELPIANPYCLYQPSNKIQPAHSFTFDHRELDSYVTYL